MIELIALFILLIGLGGMAVILIQKIPILSELTPQEVEKSSPLKKLKNKIKNNGTFKSFSGELLLQKTLSKVKNLSLKTENKTSAWLKRSRRRSLEKKKKFSKDYWKKIKEED